MGSSSYAEAQICHTELSHGRQQISEQWAQLFSLVDKSDESMHALRKQDLNNQYHVAIFFSSCLAMVVVDSYKWLTHYATDSVIAHCLLASLPPDGKFISFHMAMIINALWFTSFVLTLSAFIASYACSYYLREFRNLPQFEAKHLLAFRQMRYRFLRKWKIFVICDMIHMILPSAMLLAFFGLVLLFRTLDRPDSCIVTIAFSVVILCFLLLGLCPFLFSIFSRWNARGISPFPSPISWSLFKSGYHLLFLSYSIVDLLMCRRDKAIWKSRMRLSYPFRQHKSLRDTLQLALISGDWLEQDCSSFLDPSNAEAIDVLLADALVWIDQRPTIEKSPKIIVAIFHCILDLDLRRVLKDGLGSDEDRVAKGGLAAVFYEIAKEQQQNTHDTHLLASKRWLEGHVKHLPRYLHIELVRYLKCMEALRDGCSTPIPGVSRASTFGSTATAV